MNTHAIQTGTVALTTSRRDGVGHHRRRLLRTLLDFGWSAHDPESASRLTHRRTVGATAPRAAA